MTMTEVQWIGGGQVTEEQIRFFLSSATHDMIEEDTGDINSTYVELILRNKFLISGMILSEVSI